MEQEPNTRCECVVWREGERRCELWLVDGIGHLHVFAGETLVKQERTDPKRAYARAHELRQEPPTLDAAVVPPLTTSDETKGG